MTQSGILRCIGKAAILVGVMIGAGCGKPAPLSEATILAAWDAQREYPALTMDYPLDGAVFPPDIAPPTIRWTDSESGSNAWLVGVDLAPDPDDGTGLADGDSASSPLIGALRALVHQPEWRLSVEEWDRLKAIDAGAERPASITVLGVRDNAPDRIRSAAQIAITISADPVDAPLFYREVNLPFAEAVKDPSTIRWRFGNITSPTRPPVILENLPVCGNCHSFSSDGAWLGMDVDYANSKGSYVFTRVGAEIPLATNDIFTWDDFDPEDNHLSFGLLSQVSPDGRYAISTVKDRSVFVARSDLAFSQLFFPLKGILAFYDRETREFKALPGADNPDYVQSNPSWSPDGRYIVFARAPIYDLELSSDNVLLTAEECAEFLEGGREFRYDLYRIPFNDGAGGEPEPLEGASGNGKSNFFGRYSPDGRWIVFCQARSFMLLQPDSDLYIIPAEGGEARRLACNTPRMNSWHSWSPNGRWLVFASKANGPYTQMWLTHIDEEGRSAPPVVLDHMTAPDRAANIPEFVNLPTDATIRIREEFLNDISHRRAGDQFLRGGDYENAMVEYRKALEMNPNNAEANGQLGYLLLHHSDGLDAAMIHLRRAVELLPQNFTNRLSLGIALFETGDYAQAESHIRAALAIDPNHAEALVDYAVVLEKMNRLEEATVYYARALEMDPNQAEARCDYGWALYLQGRYDEAAAQWKEALRLDPAHSMSAMNLGLYYVECERFEEAIVKFAEAARADPANMEARLHLGLGHLFQGSHAEAEDNLVEVARAVPVWIPTIMLQLGHLMEFGYTDRAMSLAEKIRVAVDEAGHASVAQDIQRWIDGATTR